MLQSLVCISGRRHARTPLPLTQLRLRVLEPRPQVTEHRLHDDHSSHSPCTANTHGHTRTKTTGEMRNEERTGRSGVSQRRQENDRNMRSSTFLQRKHSGDRNHPPWWKMHKKMKRYLHVTVWKKMEVRGMDIPAFGLMQICSLSNDKEMNVVGLRLKILVLSVII